VGLKSGRHCSALTETRCRDYMYIRRVKIGDVITISLRVICTVRPCLAAVHTGMCMGCVQEMQQIGHVKEGGKRKRGMREM